MLKYGEEYLTLLRGGLSKSDYDACGDNVPEPLFLAIPYGYWQDLDTPAIIKNSEQCLVVSHIKWAVDTPISAAQGGLFDEC